MSETPDELREQQEARERAERERAEHAIDPEDEQAAERRAEKAAYLKEKLDEQVESEEP
jgi:hypothetical protein